MTVTDISARHPGSARATETADRDAARPTTFVVTPWWDPGVATSGVDPRDPYVERFWLPVLGPSTVWLLRRFARGFAEQPSGFRVAVLDTSLALGLGRGTGRNSPIVRTVERAATFGLLRRHDLEHLEVRTHLPLLAARHIQQLSPMVRRLHSDWVRHRDAGADPTAAGRANRS